MSESKRCKSCGNPVEFDVAQAGDGTCPWCQAAFTFDPEPVGNPVTASKDPSKQFGKYVRTEKLGAGGMGEVWKALDTELNRWVALKFLKDPDPRELARFQREARTAAGLSHPNIGSIYEIGEADGRAYIAMQYVGGRTMDTFPRDDRKVILALIRDAARAVDHAHRQGIIHRDLKPENLMVEKSDDGWRVVVLDFGLARHIEGGEKLSRSGDIVGTPAYMSPEQARAATLDERSDVYSLGATLYEVLTGRPPFEGPNLLEIIRKIGGEEPIRPRKIDPRIHRDLETIVLKCLEKNRERRYASARDLADDLDRFLRLEPIVARPASAAYRLRMTLAKRKALALVAASGLGVAAGLGWLLWSKAESDRAFREQSARREQSLKEIGALWSRMVEAKQALHVNPVDLAKEAPQVRQGIEDVVAAVGSFIERNPRLPQGYYIRARGHLYLEDFAAAEDDLRKATEVDASFAPGHAALGKLLMHVHSLKKMEEVTDLFGGGGWAVRAPSSAKKSEELLKEAQESLTRGRADPNSKESWGLTRTREDDAWDVLLAAMRAYYVDHRRPEAIRILREGNERQPSEEFMNWLGKWSETSAERTAWQTAAIARRPFYSMAYFDRAMVSMMRAIGAEKETRGGSGDPKFMLAFLEDAEKALQINPRLSALRFAVVLIQGQLGNRDAAVRHLALVAKGSPPERLSGEELSTTGYLRMMCGDFDRAIGDYTLVLERNADNGSAHFMRSAAYYLKGDREASERDFKSAFPASDAETTHYFLFRGGLLTTEGRLDEAEADFVRARDSARQETLRMAAEASLANVQSMQKWKRKGVDFDPQALFQQSMAWHRQKNYRKAAEGFRRIAATMPDSDLGRLSAYNAACGHAQLGERSEALDWLEKSIALGFRDVAHLEKDSDLDALRGEDRYRKLVERLKAN